MNSQDFQLKIKAETDISKLKELQEKLESLIETAKRNGGEYGAMEKSLAAVNDRQRELVDSAEKSCEALKEQGNILSSARKSAVGFSQAQSAVAKLMKGDLVGAARAATGAFNTFTVAIKANPLTFWLGAAMAVIGLLASLKSLFGQAAEKAKELNQAKLDKLADELKAAADAGVKLDAADFTKLGSAVDALIKQQQSLQLEFDRTLERREMLDDAEFGLALSKLNADKQRDLGKSGTPREREKVEQDYRGRELVLRQNRDRKKADDDIKDTTDQRLLAGKNLYELKGALADYQKAVEEARKNLANTQGTLDQSGAKSDQQRIIDRWEEMNNKGSERTYAEEREFAALGTLAEDARRQIEKGQATYDKIMEVIDRPEGYDKMSRAEQDEYYKNRNEVVGGMALNNEQFKMLVDLLQRQQKSDLSNPEKTEKNISELKDKVTKATETVSNLDAKRMVASIKYNTMNNQHAADNQAFKSDVNASQKQADDAAAAKMLADQILKLENQMKEALQKKSKADVSGIQNQILDLQAPKNMTPEQQKALNLAKQENLNKAKNEQARAGAKDVADHPLMVTPTAKVAPRNYEAGKVRAGNAEFTRAAADYNAAMQDAAKDGNVDDKEKTQLLAMLKNLIEIARKTNNDSADNTAEINGMAREIASLKSQIKNNDTP